MTALRIRRAQHMRRQRAFTLVEVLVALAIVVVGMAALFTTVSQAVRNSTYLRERTLAQWIALNRITETRLSGLVPSDEHMEGELEFANQRWRWELETISTPVRGIFRLEARAAPEEAPEDSWPGQATGFMGNAIAPPNTLPRDWLGTDSAPAQRGPGQGGRDNQRPPAEGPPSEPPPADDETPTPEQGEPQ
jgi:general secretion pathway protein I